MSKGSSTFHFRTWEEILGHLKKEAKYAHDGACIVCLNCACCKEKERLIMRLEERAKAFLEERDAYIVSDKGHYVREGEFEAEVESQKKRADKSENLLEEMEDLGLVEVNRLESENAKMKLALNGAYAALCEHLGHDDPILKAVWDAK